MKNYFIRLLIVGTILGGGYFLFSQENASSYSIPSIEVMRNKAGGTVNRILKFTKNNNKFSATSSIADFAGAAGVKIEEGLGQITSGVKAEAFNFFREAVNEKLNSAGENLGINIRQAGGEIIETQAESPVIFGIQAGAPAYFSVKNQETEKIGYEIDWGDGNKQNGEIAARKSAIVSHQWNVSGEFYSKFKIITSKDEKIYEIAISVISL